MIKKKITKKERIRRQRIKKIRSFVFNISIIIAFIIGSIIFINGFLDCWVDEIDAQTEYNRNYYMDTHMYKDEVLRQIQNK